MNEIISISKELINGTEVNSVNAREIHKYLGVKTRFNDWINRAIKKYDFVENLDYSKMSIPQNGNPKPMFEYIVTLDMAKELAMLENNPKGKEARKYFIQIEKEFIKSLEQKAKQKSIEYVSPLTKEGKNVFFVLGGYMSINKRLAKENKELKKKYLKLLEDFHKIVMDARNISDCVITQ